MGTYVVLAVFILIACVLLILVVLVQNSKGGGLASNFSSSNQIMGVRKTADFLEKTTWGLAIAVLVLSLFSIFAIPRFGAKNQENIDVQKQATPTQKQQQQMGGQQFPSQQTPAQPPAGK
jgi:preprotein translocase subunit SecG